MSGKYVLRVRRKEGIRVRMMKVTLFEVLSLEALSQSAGELLVIAHIRVSMSYDMRSHQRSQADRVVSKLNVKV